MAGVRPPHSTSELLTRMKSRLAGGLVLVMCAAGPSAIAQSATDQKEAATCNQRAVTVADTIKMVRLQGLHGVGQLSPDGKKFVAIVRRGVLERVAQAAGPGTRSPGDQAALL